MRVAAEFVSKDEEPPWVITGTALPVHESLIDSTGACF